MAGGRGISASAGVERIVAWLRDPRVAPALTLGGLLALTLLVFQRQLFEHWTFQWDFLGAYSTAPAFVAATIGHLHPLSWSPFVASGFPVDVNPQAEIYFPVWWLFGLLGIPLNLTAVTIAQVAHVFFGAAGVVALARVRRLAWPWAAVAGVAYLFFGGWFGNSEHADIFRGFAYLPWLFWAVTPPEEGGTWTRLVAVPPLAWLIAAGAYPGQLVSFAIVTVIYMIVALRVQARGLWSAYRIVIALVTIASAALTAAILLPYLIANHDHQLIRVFQPTAAIRAAESFSPIDLLGLELNPFALHPDGTIFSVALALPILIGLACSTRRSISRHLPLLVTGIAALLLATTPKIDFVGNAMVKLGTIFPSRFPASDYKAAIAIAIVILSAEAWAHIASGERVRLWAAAAFGLLAGAAALLARSTYAPTTRTMWLLVAVIVATVALIAWRPRKEWLVLALIGLIVVDGVRDARDIRATGGVSSWQVTASQAIMYRNYQVHVDDLSKVLRRAPRTRPARVPAWASVTEFPRGNPPDAAGWEADGYHFLDYTGPLATSMYRIEQSPVLVHLMLEPWHAWVFTCAATCDRSASSLPAPSTWHASPSMQTVSYGPGRIVYRVHLNRPSVMVENEVSFEGWHSNTPQAQVIKSPLPLRTWRLAAGDYTFVASYQEPDRDLQYAAVAISVLAFLGAMMFVLRRRRQARQTQAPAG
jgi:hypothetical protein